MNKLKAIHGSSNPDDPPPIKGGGKGKWGEKFRSFAKDHNRQFEARKRKGK